MFLKQFGVLVVIGVVGSGILLYGLWGELASEQATVEIVKSGSQPTRSDLLITVDIAGSVEKPGLYKLPSGSRIGDGLVVAGGLSAGADRDMVAKIINLAEVIEDGGKIYIPSIHNARETPLSAQAGSQSNSKGVTLGVTSTKININTASLGELDSLTGIGEARAKLILDNRPYAKTDDLVSKAKIPQSIYDKIKDLVSVY